MKFSFCYTIKKIIKKNKNKDSTDYHLYIPQKDDNEVEIICGPWRDTEEEAKKDKKMFNKDKKAFFKMLKE